MKTFRQWLLTKLLNPAQLALVEAIDRPDRFMPDNPLTVQEAEQWGSLLLSPTLVKIDHAMINWTQQEAQRAIMSPTADLPRMAGYAVGVRAGWNMAKTLSRLAAAKDGQSENEAPTAAEPLAHAQP